MRNPANPPLPTFLPGTLHLCRGDWRDYDALAPFHYAAGRPATTDAIWTIRYAPRHPSSVRSRIVAVGVLSYPAPSCFARERCLGRRHLSRKRNLRFANRHVRTISRVIVHPQFRALGLSTALVRWICQHCKTRYIEAIAAMGTAHPFFERAGMRRVELAAEDLARRRRRRKRPYLYFFLDRSRRRSRSRSRSPRAKEL